MRGQIEDVLPPPNLPIYTPSTKRALMGDPPRGLSPPALFSRENENPRSTVLMQWITNVVSMQKKLKKLTINAKKNRKKHVLDVADLCRAEAAEMCRPRHPEPLLEQVQRPEKMVFPRRTWGNMRMAGIVIGDVLLLIPTLPRGRQRAPNHWQEQKPISERKVESMDVK
jgi:hypothetical protein